MNALTSNLLSTRRLLHLTENSIFEAYCLDISQSFCPYLNPAAAQNVLYASTYTIPPEVTTLAEVQAEIFYQCVLYTEYLRIFRKGDNARGTLACENILFDIPSHLQGVSGPELFDWPHWTLKCLYSSVGIMFGKFWQGEEDISRNGITIPPPPLHFMSIRSAIKLRDPYFLDQQPTILAQIVASLDDGSNVHLAAGYSTGNIISLEQMRSAHYYEQARTWANTQIESIEG